LYGEGIEHWGGRGKGFPYISEGDSEEVRRCARGAEALMEGGDFILTTCELPSTRAKIA